MKTPPFGALETTFSVGNSDSLETNIFEISMMMCVVVAARTDSVKSKCFV